jgi:peroxiredoxin
MWISIPSLRTSLVFLAVLMACVVAFILAMLGAAYFAKPSRAVHLRTTEGYDFGFASDEKLPWVGPKVGDRINLTRLKTQEGVTLASMTGNKMVMVVLLDSPWGACKAATDEMHDVQNRIAPSGIEYYPMSVTTLKSSAQFVEYTRSLGIRAPALLWQRRDEVPPESLFTMVLPSHPLLDANGLIVRKWPGTDQSAKVREKMANQIVADTVEELKRTRPAT